MHLEKQMKSKQKPLKIPRPKWGDEEVDNGDARAFIEMDIPFSKAMTIHDFSQMGDNIYWALEDLADAFVVELDALLNAK